MGQEGNVTCMRRPYVGVGAVVLCGRKIAMMRRRNPSGFGTWSTPGGYLDFGESPYTCAQREFQEEVGLRVEGFQFLCITNDVIVDSGKHFVTIWMFAHVASEAKLAPTSPEVAEASWFEIGSLPKPLFPPFTRLINGECTPPRDIRALFPDGER